MNMYIHTHTPIEYNSLKTIQLVYHVTVLNCNGFYLQSEAKIDFMSLLNTFFFSNPIRAYFDQIKISTSSETLNMAEV